MKKVDKFAVVCGMLLLSILAAGLPSIREQYVSETLSYREGLPYSYVDDIFQDENGLLWLCLYGGGISRYDGKSFRTLTTRGEPALASDFVTTACQDHFHRLWVSSQEGLSLIDPVTMRLLPLPEEVRALSEGCFCNSVTTDKDGNVWFAAQEMLYRIAFSEDGTVRDIKHLNLRVNGRSTSNSRIPVFKDVLGDGRIWIILGGKICTVQAGEEPEMQALPLSDQATIANGIKIMDYIRKGDQVWIATVQGLYRLDIATGRMRHYLHYPADPGSLIHDQVPALGMTEDGQLLVGTLRGLNLYDPLSDAFRPFITEEGKEGSNLLLNDMVNCIRTVGTDIWIGTEAHGITRLIRKRLPVSELRHLPGEPSSLPLNPVSALYFDKDGRQWIGTAQEGLYLRQRGETSVHSISGNGLLDNSPIQSLMGTSDGRVWAGTWGQGLFQLDKGRIRSVPLGTGSSHDNHISSLAYDPASHRLFVASRKYLYSIQTETGAQTREFELEYTGRSLLFLDGQQRLWLCHENGILLTDLATSSKTVYPVSQVVTMAQTPEGTLLMGTSGDGLYQSDSIDTASIHYRRIGQEDGLSDNRIRSILTDGDETWVATGNGISLMTESGIQTFSIADGLANNEFYRNAACKGLDRRLYFGHNEGISLILPHQRIPQEGRRPLLFTLFHLNGNTTYLSPDTPVRLHERDKGVAFEFADLSFRGTNEINYRYRLLPSESDWITLSPGQQILHFGKLPSGRLTLELKAVKPSGEEVGQTSLPINVRSYFYKTPWFAALILLAFVLCARVFMLTKTRSLKRKQKELQEEILRHIQDISRQKETLEEKTKELSRQNEILAQQNEELAGQKMLFSIDLGQLQDKARGQDFALKVMKTIQSLYKDPSLDIGTFCEAMGMSQSMLNVRMNETLGMPVVQFIRTYRLSVAKEILSHKNGPQMSVAEIAYEVGFNDPKYFTRCFTKEFGIPPSALLK